MRASPTLLLIAALACADAGAPTAPATVPRPVLQPAKVEAIGAKVRNGTDRAVVVEGQMWIGDELVTLEFHNEGGPGRFVAEFWGPAQGDVPVLWHSSFPTNVGGGMTETATWQIEVADRPSSSPPRIQWIVIRTFQTGGTWPETSRIIITDWPQ